MLHWGDAAVVTFHRKPTDESWEDLGGIAVPDLPAKWPQIAPFVQRDSYFSINSTYVQRRAATSDVTGLPIYSRKADQLQWLNGAVVDLDLYNVRPQINLDEALEKFAFQLECSSLPTPNVISFSGRGVWALWGLCDHANRATPVPAHPERRDILERVNRALVAQFSNLGADPASTDAARVMRIPCTLNSTAKFPVRFVRLSDERYTLPELASILAVPAEKVRFSGERRTTPKNAAKVKAGRMRWRVPLDGFLRLWKMRGHFTKHTRRNAVYIYSILLRRNQAKETEIIQKCLRLAASCQPVLPPNDACRCVSSSKNAMAKNYRHWISNATIARMLRITNAEKAEVAEWFKPQQKKKSDQIEERRRAILVELSSAGVSLENPVSTREMARRLQKYGIHVGYGTVFKDYQALREQISAVTPIAQDVSTVNFLVLEESTSPLCTSRGKLNS